MGATTDRPVTRRFTSDEVWRMVDIGLIGPHEPYEFVDGELVYVSPQGETHAEILMDLNELLMSAYAPRFRLRPQLPVGGIHDSIPEPDIAIVAREALGRGTAPRADQSVLLVEVAVTSQAPDRRKGQIYAAAGAPVYWIVDVAKRVVRVHTGPLPDGTWREVSEVPLEGTLRLPAIEAEVPAAAILRSALPGS